MAAKAFDIRYPGISVYEALVSKDLSKEEKAKIVAEAIDSLSKEFPNLKHVATQRDLSETELKLMKEIKELDVKLSKDIQDSELRLTKEIENTRKEIKELDLKLTKEIKELDIKSSKERDAIKLALTKEIENTKFTMLKWQFIFWASQMGVILTIAYKILSVKG